MPWTSVGLEVENPQEETKKKRKKFDRGLMRAKGAKDDGGRLTSLPEFRKPGIKEIPWVLEFY